MEDLVLSCLESRVEENRNLYARFLVGPFLRGDALTVATALRRVLLSSVESIGINALSIQGITHEFSTIVGVRESVLELSLNFGAIVLSYDKAFFKKKSFFDKPQIGYLQVQGPKVIYANHLKLPLGVKLVDPTQYIATVSKEGSVVLKFVIGKRNDFLHQHIGSSSHLEERAKPLSVLGEIGKKNIVRAKKRSLYKNGSTIDSFLGGKALSFRNRAVLCNNAKLRVLRKNRGEQSNAYPCKARSGHNLCMRSPAVYRTRPGSRNRAVFCKRAGLQSKTLYGAQLVRCKPNVAIQTRVCKQNGAGFALHDQDVHDFVRGREQHDRVALDRSKRARVSFASEALHSRCTSLPSLGVAKQGNSLKGRHSSSYKQRAKLCACMRRSVWGSTRFLNLGGRSVPFTKGLQATHSSCNRLQNTARLCSCKQNGVQSKPPPFPYGDRVLQRSKTELGCKEVVLSSSRKAERNKKKVGFLSDSTVFLSNTCLRNVIPLDLSLTPVLKVNFVIEIDDEVLYLRQKIRERIILEVWTNGSIHPRQAVHDASLRLLDMFATFRSVYQLR